jgi:hypothetical protein
LQTVAPRFKSDKLAHPLNSALTDRHLGKNGRENTCKIVEQEETITGSLIKNAIL